MLSVSGVVNSGDGLIHPMLFLLLTWAEVAVPSPECPYRVWSSYIAAASAHSGVTVESSSFLTVLSYYSRATITARFLKSFCGAWYY